MWGLPMLEPSQLYRLNNEHVCSSIKLVQDPRSGTSQPGTALISEGSDENTRDYAPLLPQSKR